MPKKERKPKTKTKLEPLTDAERHRRFVDMAHEVDASDDPKDFDEAFNKIASTKAAPSKSAKSKAQ